MPAGYPAEVEAQREHADVAGDEEAHHDDAHDGVGPVQPFGKVRDVVFHGVYVRVFVVWGVVA